VQHAGQCSAGSAISRGRRPGWRCTLMVQAAV
jgi:hypothetical protein